MKTQIFAAFVVGVSILCGAEEKVKPVELEVLKDSVGVWEATIKVWPEGPEGESMTMTAVETNAASGEYWIASHLDTEFDGEVMTVHSIVGYDLDRKALVGKVIDHGPYAAHMTGTYDAKSKTIHWMTKVKDAEGKPIVQKTTVTQKSADERVLVLSVPGKEKGEFTKFMEIKYVRRK